VYYEGTVVVVVVVGEAPHDAQPPLAVATYVTPVLVNCLTFVPSDTQKVPPLTTLESKHVRLIPIFVMFIPVQPHSVAVPLYVILKLSHPGVPSQAAPALSADNEYIGVTVVVDVVVVGAMVVVLVVVLVEVDVLVLVVVLVLVELLVVVVVVGAIY
jgi:hypothetical protein